MSASPRFASKAILPIGSRSSSSTTVRRRIRPTRCSSAIPARASFGMRRTWASRPATTLAPPRQPATRWSFSTTIHVRILIGCASSWKPRGRRGAAAVASCILDWSGERIDFVEGAVNFQGKGFQLHYGAPAGSVTLEEKPLLFACGCAMLIDRAVFVDAGAWDEGAFAYYEDVELGWRLNLLGHAVWFAPRAIVYHKHHGTSGRWAEPPRIRLYERNSLRMLYGLLETRSLERVLPAALLLAADRALLNTRLSRVEDIRRHPTWKHFVRSIKALLRAQGINKTTPIGQAIKRLGIRGFVRVARDVFVAPPGETSRPRRAAYLIEQGEIPSTFDTQFEALPINAAAMLAGIYGFLSDLPALSRRRADLQQPAAGDGPGSPSGIRKPLAVASPCDLSGRARRDSRRAGRRVRAGERHFAPDLGRGRTDDVRATKARKHEEEYIRRKSSTRPIP